MGLTRILFDLSSGEYGTAYADCWLPCIDFDWFPKYGTHMQLDLFAEDLYESVRDYRDVPK